MFNIRFDGRLLPDFIKVKNVGFSVLPAVNHSFKQIAGGGNVKTANINLGAKIFNIEVVVVKDSNKSLTEMCRELSVWCIGNNFNLSPLVFLDDPNVMYQAVVSNNVEINDIIVAGEGNIQMTVPNGIAIGGEKMVMSVSGSAKCVYNGTAPSFPCIEIFPATTLSNYTLTFTNSATGEQFAITGNINYNESITIDCAKKVVKRGNSLDLKMIKLESDWIKFSNAGTYTITCNHVGIPYSVTYKENYY